MSWNAFLDPVFKPILSLGPFLAILIVSFAISLIITLVYKWVTDQGKMKSLKEEQKEYQQRIKGLKENPAEMMKVQKEAMKKNMEYMKHSFKPTLITMLPIILIFGWMAAHLSFEPIYPGETYSITAEFQKGVTGTVTLVPDTDSELVSSQATQNINEGVTWRLKSNTLGNHILTLDYGGQFFTKKVLISKELEYEDQISIIQNSDLKQIKIDYNKLRPLGPNFDIFGWQPGWLGLYIIFSLIFSMSLRKLMKIY